MADSSFGPDIKDSLFYSNTADNSSSDIVDSFSDDLAPPNPPSDGLSDVNPENLKGTYLIYFIHSRSSQCLSDAIDIVLNITPSDSMETLSFEQNLAICMVLNEPSRHTVGEQYPPAYLRAWAKLSSFARLVDAKKGLSQHTHKPTVDPVTLLQQFSQDFGVVFTPTSTLTGVLKNIHKNGLPPRYKKASYTITELYNLTK